MIVQSAITVVYRLIYDVGFRGVSLRHVPLTLLMWCNTFGISAAAIKSVPIALFLCGMFHLYRCIQGTTFVVNLWYCYSIISIYISSMYSVHMFISDSLSKTILSYLSTIIVVMAVFRRWFALRIFSCASTSSRFPRPLHCKDDDVPRASFQ